MKGFLPMAGPRILFMGTPDFALPALQSLYDRGYPLVGVVTQPDRPKGRGLKDVAPPVKILADKLGLPVFQPASTKDPSFMKLLSELNPEMIVVVAFGQILPKSVIDYPPRYCLNIHPSLLPKYRGAAPMNWAIIRGETKTGVTIMVMDEGMDSGDILLQEETPIGKAETFGELHDRLAQRGADLLIKTIEQITAGTVKRMSQNASAATFAPRLKKDMCKINWNSKCSDIVNLIRGLNPSPAAFTFWNGQNLKIFAAEARPGRVDHPPATIAGVCAAGLPVAAADGYVVLKDVQLSGKKRMPITDFLRGHRINEGSVLQ